MLLYFAIAILLSFLLLNREEYQVLIDAGSTGSRIHIYHFHDGHLINETFHQITPGLSHYLADGKVQEAAESILPLLQLAKNYSTRPEINVQATAGLRLLDESIVEKAFERIRQVIIDQGLKPGSIGILSGSDEAFYAYKSIEYFMSENVGLLDMGGASIQVVYPSDTVEEHKEFYRERVYHHSHLGFGLMEARKKASGKHCHSKSSDLLHEAFSNCKLLVDGLFHSFANVHKPKINTREIYLFSYFYDKIRLFIDIEQWYLSDIHELNRIICHLHYDNEADINSKFIDHFSSYDEFRQHFVSKVAKDEHLCFDLTFIHATLEKYDIKDQLLRINKKINGYELGWYLGYILNRRNS